MIDTGSGDDWVRTGQGDDEMTLGGGNDVADTGAGDGTIEGGANDRIGDLAHGGDGDDTLYWGPTSGNDTFHGGDGRDTLSVHARAAEVLAGLAVPPEFKAVFVNGAIEMRDSLGHPVTFSGTLTIGGQTVTFTSVERIAYRP